MAIIYGEYINESSNVFTSGDFDEYKEYGEARIKEMTSKERKQTRH